MKSIVFMVAFSAILLVSGEKLHAQLGIKAVLFSPTGDFGFAMKKTVWPEIIWKSEFETSFRNRIYGSFSLFNPRTDTVRTVAYESSGSGNKVLEGYIVYGKTWNLTLAYGYDFSPDFMSEWKVRPFLGLDFNTGAHFTGSTRDTGVSNISEELTTVFGGIVGRVGAEANFDKFGIFIDVARHYNLVLESSSFAFTSFGLGVNYFFN